jgi:hypothetical protein
MPRRCFSDAMDFETKQIQPPKDWSRFEDLCLALWREIWQDPLATKNGRRGQAQAGVDVFGQPQGSTAWHGVQCKGKEQGYGTGLTIAEVHAEVAKASTFSPRLTRYVIATTALRDSDLQQEVRELSAARVAKGDFSVHVLAWDDIQDLIARYRPVLERFYPEHRADATALLDRLANFPSSAEVQSVLAIAAHGTGPARAEWLDVSFAEPRDLGPALSGRGLGPGDASACPRLHEVDVLLHELSRAYTVRLTGVPGAGKSICCYQAAASLHREGWQVRVLRWPPPDRLNFPADSGERVLFLIDDAHRLPVGAVAQLELQCNASRYLLSTFNSAENDETVHGAIALDARRAVRTVAQGMRRMPELLEIVRKLDDRVGSSFLDEDLQQRISAAEQESQYPWQFCFIVGAGGGARGAGPMQLG